MSSPASTLQSKTAIPWFGRAFRITVVRQDGSTFSISSDQSQSLRVQFNMDLVMMMAYWSAEVSIFNVAADENAVKAYNLNQSSVSLLNRQVSGISNLQDFWKFNQPLVAGDNIIISAGYESTGTSTTFNPQANILYQGRILQPIWTRDQVVDYKLTLRCVTGLLDDALKTVNLSIESQVTAYDTIGRICDAAGIQRGQDDQDAIDALKSITYPKYQTVRGSPFNEIRKIAQQKGLQSWVSPAGLNIRKFTGTLSAPKVAYGPPGTPSTGTVPIKPTLIGTPQQTQDGITFRVLMDSSLRIGDSVQITPNVLINPFPLQIGRLPAVPSRNGQYVICGLQHHGDTRGQGNDWYTEVTGVTQDFFLNLFQATSPITQKSGK
jgi:hypothetical protein